MTVDAKLVDDTKSAEVLSALALLYHRHGDPARALALGLAAMQLAPPTPALVLLVTATFLKTDDPEQALAAYERLDKPYPSIATPPTDIERDAGELLHAKILFRMGKNDAAQEALARAKAAVTAL